MKRLIILCLFLLLLPLTAASDKEDTSYDLDSLKDYQKEYLGEDVGVCAYSSVKTYMDYKAITAKNSTQYKYIRDYMNIDSSGLLVDKDGFIGVALGSYYGVIGDRYYFTLDNGIVLPLVKVEEKADSDTVNGCSHPDGSVIEFVIDSEKATDFFGRWGNDLILSGNFNNSSWFKGEIKAVEKVTEEKNPNYVLYEAKEETYFDNYNIFAYDNGY